MPNLRYTKDHEWISVDGDLATVGITEYAQDQLGDIVFVELPEVGRTVAAGEEVAVVESVKAASEVYAPVAGQVAETNPVLSDAPETVNADATGDGWFLRIRMADPGEFDQLLDEAAYAALTGEA
ncbi:MAG: glycine cleavage system protein GcvH [Rhodospirillales bacterium]|nr:glycine cleavage system protein GcvH [Rhodospirillales bacterium]